jgi:DUF1009 family protein
MRKLGLIAGGGTLPITLARHCHATGRPLFVIRLAGFAGPELDKFDGCDLTLGRLGAAIDALRDSGCKAVCMAGVVDRPDLSNLRPDLRGLAAMPRAVVAAAKGDDALLTFLVRVFEGEGFIAEGAQEVMAELVLRTGALGRRRPRRSHQLDIRRSMDAAAAIGRLDAGQAAVSCEGLILALEAQEGTDAMLERVARLPAAVRGDPRRPRGVLAKVCKPDQDRRVDLPTIGPGTIRRAAEAGLAGVVGQAGLTLVLDRDRVRILADELCLFVFGVADKAS